jgi:GNAT superfamily N-acetyltransferase
MTDPLPIRLAEPDDMETILRLINQAAAWLRTKGTDQWAEPWPNEEARNDRISRGIQGGSTWIAEDHGEAIATVTYREVGNQNLWTPSEQGDPAVYVSRLIVSRKRAGDGIGAALIDWAGYQAREEWEAKWIRIDVWTTNIALHNYYKEQQFIPVRVCDMEDNYPSAALFEKPTAEIDEAAVARFTKRVSRSLEPGRTPLPA